MAKRKVVWSPQAKLEQYQILQYYFQRNENKQYSAKLYNEFRKSIELIRLFPKIGMKSDIRGVRVISRGDYSIFYKLINDRIEILSICDNRQDQSGLNF